MRSRLWGLYFSGQSASPSWRGSTNSFSIEGRERKDMPFVPACIVQESSRQIVLMPAGHRQENSSVLFGTCIKRASVPFPHHISISDTLRFLLVLDWIINDSDVESHPRNCAANARAGVKSSMTHDLKYVRVSEIGSLGHRADILTIKSRGWKKGQISGGIYDPLNI